MENDNIQMAGRIAQAVAQAGGRTFYVGGCVRDRLLGRETKDVDLEIHGISVQTLEKILDGLGDRTVMGASFGVFGLRHYDLDIAMPRSETSIGPGHKDFDVCVDPFIGPEKAALRRDFTMNALMQDALTGEVLDFFGGREDMARKLIRHVNDMTFGEDPLRVFRAAQFAARFGFSVAEETVRLSASMDVRNLASERVMGEMEKALLKAAKPSVFFETLREMNQLAFWFPEVKALIGIEQNPVHHPEGDVWTHTMQVLDEAASLREQSAYPLGLMLSALCHDFGKATASAFVKGAIHAYGHEQAGLPLVERFLARLTSEVKLTRYVLNMTALHMQPNMKVRNQAHVKSFMKMFDESLSPEDLLLLAKADHLGRKALENDSAGSVPSYGETEGVLKDMLAVYKERMGRPTLMGKDLLAAGMQPGPLLGEALQYAHQLHLAGIPKEEQLTQTLGFIRKKEKDGSRGRKDD